MKTLEEYESYSGIGYTQGSGSGEPRSYQLIADITNDIDYDADEWTYTDADYAEIRRQLGILDPEIKFGEYNIVAVFVRDLSEMCQEYVVVINWQN